jgi:Protein of unknown function (DUF1350)
MRLGLMEWLEISGNWVLIPRRPIGMIHFLGGAFVATLPHLSYRRLLEFLAEQGYVIIATPFVNTFEHTNIAETVLWQFDRTRYALEDRYIAERNLPIFGLGHSMGCKLHLLIGSLYEVERSGNILISFNNFAAKDSIPLMGQMSQMMQQFAPQLGTLTAPEFSPTPDETNRLVRDRYEVSNNLLVKFSNDTLDQTRPLSAILDDRFPGGTALCKLKGNHMTPVAQDLKWDANPNFTPLDALGSWFKQEVFREIEQLEQEILYWLRESRPFPVNQRTGLP